MPGKPVHPKKITRPRSKPRRISGRPKHKQLYCDCGQPAITVLLVKVGSDPQYMVRLPLCPACLVLEEEFKKELRE